MSKSENFIAKLITELRLRQPEWQIKDHHRIEWAGQPRNRWPKADILIAVPAHLIAIEYCDDIDPLKNLIKYWPIFSSSPDSSITLIQIWKRGTKIRRSHTELTRWTGNRLMEVHPNFSYLFIEKRNRSVEAISDELIELVKIGI